MRWTHGIVAGLTATIVLSILMIVKAAMNLVPDVNAVQMLTGMGTAYLGLPANLVVGWIAHFLIGTVAWGLLFAATYPLWPGRPTIKGILFSIVAWLLMMIVVMPLAGGGLFGANIGLQPPVATLILHVVFGAVLGYTYAKLAERRPRRSAAPAARRTAPHETARHARR